MHLDSFRVEFTRIQKSHNDNRNQLRILTERGLHSKSRGVLNKNIWTFLMSESTKSRRTGNYQILIFSWEMLVRISLKTKNGVPRLKISCICVPSHLWCTWLWIHVGKSGKIYLNSGIEKRHEAMQNKLYPLIDNTRFPLTLLSAENKNCKNTNTLSVFFIGAIQKSMSL